MREGVARVDEDGVDPGQAGPAGNARADGGEWPYRGRRFHAAVEEAADDAFMHEIIAHIEPSARRELRHARRGSGAAG